MTGNDLLFAIGDINDSLVERAEIRWTKARKPAKKKTKAVYFVAAAACLVITFIIVNGLIQSYKDNTDNGGITGDLPSMIYINDTLYQAYADDEELNIIPLWPIEYLGEITSTVSSGEEPLEEFQANDEILGAKLYQYGEDVLVVFADNCWRYHPVTDEWFEKNGID